MAIESWFGDSSSCSTSANHTHTWELLLGPASPAPSSPGSRSHRGRLLEGSAEGGFGIVAHLPRYRRDLGAALNQEIGGDLHPPLGQILHRRLADQLGE